MLEKEQEIRKHIDMLIAEAIRSMPLWEWKAPYELPYEGPFIDPSGGTSAVFTWEIQAKGFPSLKDAYDYAKKEELK